MIENVLQKSPKENWNAHEAIEKSLGKMTKKNENRVATKKWNMSVHGKEVTTMRKKDVQVLGTSNAHTRKMRSVDQKVGPSDQRDKKMKNDGHCLKRSHFYPMEMKHGPYVGPHTQNLKFVAQNNDLNARGDWKHPVAIEKIHSGHAEKTRGTVLDRELLLLNDVMVGLNNGQNVKHNVLLNPHDMTQSKNADLNTKNNESRSPVLKKMSLHKAVWVRHILDNDRSLDDVKTQDIGHENANLSNGAGTNEHLCLEAEKSPIDCERRPDAA